MIKRIVKIKFCVFTSYFNFTAILSHQPYWKFIFQYTLSIFLHLTGLSHSDHCRNRRISFCPLFSMPLFFSPIVLNSCQYNSPGIFHLDRGVWYKQDRWWSPMAIPDVPVHKCKKRFGVFLKYHKFVSILLFQFLFNLNKQVHLRLYILSTLLIIQSNIHIENI